MSLIFERSIPSGKKKSRFDKVFNEHSAEVWLCWLGCRWSKRHQKRDWWSCLRSRSRGRPTPMILRMVGQLTASSLDGYSPSSVLLVGLHSCERWSTWYQRWDGSCCSLRNQLWQQADLPVVDGHDGQLLLEPLRWAAHQSGNCHHRDCLHQEETKVESGFVLISTAKDKITTFVLRIMLI